jgi:hypothetical protein
MMEPGRDLDALVAKEIFDEPWPIEELHFRDIGNGWLALAPKSYPGSPEANCRINDVLPKFSADMAAAWEMVEKIRGNGLTVEVFYGWECFGDFKKDDWVAQFEEAERVHTGIAKTAPHAICLAGLKAMAGNDHRRKT